ncbi:MAG: helix-turn-helix transcriptional regulator [bacterium]
MTSIGRWMAFALASQPERTTWKSVALRAGLSYSYLIQIKNGHEQPSRATLQRLEVALGCPFAEEPGLPGGASGRRASQFKGILGEFRAVPVLASPMALQGPSMGRDQMARVAPLEPDRDREGKLVFVIAADDGLAPAIPCGALCLTDPDDNTPGSIPQPYVLSIAGAPTLVRYVTRYGDSYRISLHPLADRRTRESALKVQMPGVLICGRVIEVRYQLPAAGARGSR